MRSQLKLTKPCSLGEKQKWFKLIHLSLSFKSVSKNNLNLPFITSTFLFHLHTSSAIILSSSRPQTMYKTRFFCNFTTNVPFACICKFIIFDLSAHCYCFWCIPHLLSTVKRRSSCWAEINFPCSLSLKVLFMHGDDSSPPHQTAGRFFWNRPFCLLTTFLTLMLLPCLPEEKHCPIWMDN